MVLIILIITPSMNRLSNQAAFSYLWCEMYKQKKPLPVKEGREGGGVFFILLKNELYIVNNLIISNVFDIGIVCINRL